MVYLVWEEFSTDHGQNVVAQIGGIFETHTQARLHAGDLAEFHASEEGAEKVHGVSPGGFVTFTIRPPRPGVVTMVWTEGREFGPTRA
jgi:hypothetical protein